ncbi:hypothetical protein B0H13DRAFT_1672817 [Mycena leptocephala]|nr:hypothetical protein B0H13DRAFT_1672817 [Mycena leptocephala]
MLSPALLHPLSANSVQFSYCFDHPLQCIATRYTDSNSLTAHSDTSTATCFVFACGISLSQETWIPIIKELFRLSSATSHLQAHSAWVIERPNHGESALINAELLKTHYSVQFPSLQYSTAIHTFLTLGFLSASERNNLVGIGHSGVVVHSINYGMRDGHPIPLKSLFLLETPLTGPEAWPLFQELYEGVKKSNARRTTSWPSKNAAMKWFTTHPPWKYFSADVLQIIEDTYFISDLERPGYVTTKTKVEQETASFVDNGTQLQAIPFLLTILDVLPTHLILGAVNDLMTPVLYDLIFRNIQQVHAHLASLTVIADVGHYVSSLTFVFERV